MKHLLESKELFLNSESCAAYDFIMGFKYPWEALPNIKEFILEYAKTLDADCYNKLGEDIWISKEASVAKSASIAGPCIIMAGAEIRHCAFIRGSAFVGKGAVVGNSCELKNCILFDGAQIPHFNYVGDSIIGYKSHLGAGAITSNLKSDKSLVTIRIENEKIETGIKKFGAILGDFVEVGCNSVLNPGSVIGTNSNIYPLSFVRGFVPKNSIMKKDRIVTKM